MARFVNPFTNFGFKKLFGEEANKDLLKDFLNSLLQKKHQILVRLSISFKREGIAVCNRCAKGEV